jgi:pyochelin biosynthesis protein PchC
MSQESKENLWIRCFRPSPNCQIRLICFPHAGGAATYYLPLSKALAPEVEVLSIQYPGRQDRRLEEPVDSITELALQVHRALGPWTDVAFAFFGHSMGATVAFEVARIFARNGESGPVRFFASGRRAPSRRRPESVHLRDDSGLTAELREVGATDERFLRDPEILATILPTARNDYKAIETYSYEPGPALNCPVMVLVGDSDRKTTLDEANAWREHCVGEFDVRVFPGGHFYLDSCQQELTELISSALKR